MNIDYDIIIIGAGLSGLSAAIACAYYGLSVAVIDKNGPQSLGKDGRASALSPSSLRMLERLSVDFGPHLTPIKDMVVYDGHNSDAKIHFNDPAKLGAVIENSHLRAALWDYAATQDGIDIIAPAKIIEHHHDGGSAQMTILNLALPDQQPKNTRTDLDQDPRASGTSHRAGGHDDPIDVIGAEPINLQAKLFIAADGRNSYMRRQAKIEMSAHDYGQDAMVCIIEHSLPHQGLALQRFMQGGPIAVLPLKGARSQIIWSDQRRAIQALMQLNDAEFLQLLGARLGDYLGVLNLKSARQSYPLHLALASSLTAPRLALIGDAAHIIHPLAGQGLNLAFRDIAALSHCLGRDFRRGQDIGLSSLQDYSRWRGTDTRLMAGASHGFNRIFGLQNPLAAQIRRMGLHWVNNTALLKSSFMSEAAGNLGDLPELMRISL